MEPELVPTMVRAKLTLDRDGRESPVRGNFYRPNHNFGTAENPDFKIGQVEFPTDRGIELGETLDVAIRFFVLPADLQKLRPGFRWRVQEARQLVGHGEIVDVLESGNEI